MLPKGFQKNYIFLLFHKEDVVPRLV